MESNRFTLSGQVQRFPGFGGWFYVTLPQPLVEEIKQKFRHVKRGWSSYPVKALLGSTVWTTSIFPHSSYYFIAIKAEVRKKETVTLGDRVALSLEIKDDIFN